MGQLLCCLLLDVLLLLHFWKRLFFTFIGPQYDTEIHGLTNYKRLGLECCFPSNASESARTLLAADAHCLSLTFFFALVISKDHKSNIFVTQFKIVS